MRLDVDHIEESFAGISPRLDELTMLFYTDLFTSHPEIKPLFGHVDLVRQRRKLAAMLTLIVTNLRRMDVLISALRSLGARHLAYGAEPEHYDWTAEALLRSLERISGDEWNEDVARAWAGAISLVTTEMRAGESEESQGRADAGEDDLELLMEIASNPSLSFRPNSLFATYVEKKKTDHEMELARRVQQSLIPPELPDVDGYRFSASYEPAADVGGDYFDWLRTDDGRLCFMIGDVAGKGVPGALIMCRVSGAARAVLSLESDPARVLTAINRHLCDRMPPGQFVTMALLTLDSAAHEFTLASAGHLPLLHRRATGEAEYLGHERTGLPVGIDRGVDYDEVTASIEPGDALVLFTDGVSEAMSPSGELFGMERLRRCAARVASLADLGPGLLAGVRRFAAGRAANDDLTIMTVARVDH